MNDELRATAFHSSFRIHHLLLCAPSASSASLR
jgi:hypothetical protein